MKFWSVHTSMITSPHISLTTFLEEQSFKVSLTMTQCDSDDILSTVNKGGDIVCVVVDALFECGERTENVIAGQLPVDDEFVVSHSDHMAESLVYTDLWENEYTCTTAAIAIKMFICMH